MIELATRGGYSENFRVVCAAGTLKPLTYTVPLSALQPYSRLDAEPPYPILV